MTELVKSAIFNTPDSLKFDIDKDRKGMNLKKNFFFFMKCIIIKQKNSVRLTLPETLHVKENSLIGTSVVYTNNLC